MKIRCNNPPCRFCCVGDTFLENHCCADNEVILDWHWVDDSQCLLSCITFEPREDEDNG